MDNGSKKRYDPSCIESKWAKIWEEKKIYQVNIKKAKKPFYNLAMFPYPSGEGLHVGHIVPYSGVDTFGRYKRMKGFDVFEPMGFDSFGIHSENFAIKLGKHPRELIKETISYFRDKQMKRLGIMFDWSRQVVVSDPEYYKWTQWLFVQMFKYGLAKKKMAPVTYCPSCKTVLSDEQTEQRGGVVVCERCKTPIERREMKQWFFKITRYAERLLSHLPKINWSERTKLAQKNWIGKSEGINIIYKVKGITDTITCFTTTPVNFGATFIVVAPEHGLVKKIINREIKVPDNCYREIKNYIEKTGTKTEQERISEGKDKTGVFTGLYAINHLTGKQIPVWASDFILVTVGTGAVQGCPGHDRRDFHFARKFGIPIPRVVTGPTGESGPIKKEEDVVEKGSHGKMINSDFLNGMEFADAMQKTMDYFEEKGWGKRVTNYRLRDWCVSRQRYWGPPIPMIYCQSCSKRGITYFDLLTSKAKMQNAKIKMQKTRSEIAASASWNDNSKLKITTDDFSDMPGWFPVLEEELPVLLPETKDYLPDGSGKSPLARIPEFVHTKCPHCGGRADRETDVSDTFLDSSWYFLRYPSAAEAISGQAPFDPELTRKWLPVDMYIGGQEHAVLHLMYARFVTMALHDIGYIDFEEPFTKFFAHGLMVKEGAKMSKSRGNVVDPVKYLDLYGSDVLRMYVLFMGPYDQQMDFRDRGIDGMYRFLGRVWTWVNAQMQNSGTVRQGRIEIDNKNLLRKLHKTIKGVGEDIEGLRFNTAIAKLMEFLNEASKTEVRIEVVKTYLKLLAPFAPFIAEELWFQINNYQIGERWSVHQQPWPEYNEGYLREENVIVVVQINGKVRDSLSIPFEKAQEQEQVEVAVKKSEKIKDYLDGKKIVKTIFLPGKLINFVVGK
jgi:leucyl-tRNA synthetase